MLDLDNLDNLHKAATPEPWGLAPCPSGGLIVIRGKGSKSHIRIGNFADAALVAAMRNALPELLRLARRARLARRVLGAAKSAADAVSAQADNLRVSNDDARYLTAMRRLNDTLDALSAALADGEDAS